MLGALDPATVNATFAQKVKWVFDAVRTGLTVSSAKLGKVGDDDFRRAVAKSAGFDGYILNAVQMPAAYEHCLPDLPSIYVAHNVEHVSAWQSAKSAARPLEKFLFAREARLLKAIEERLCQRARFVFTLAEADRHALGIAEPGKSSVLPLITRDKPVARLKDRKPVYDAGMIGTWTWQPNRIGLEWFLDHVVPKLDPEFDVAVAGSIPAGMKPRQPNVHFVGRVDDADEFARSAAVIPLVSRAGTGVQLKSIETFELGLPAVATTSALRGISMIPDNCEIADEPSDFAAALQRLARESSDIDGSAFFHSQRQRLDKSIANGLLALGHVPEREVA